MSLLTLLARANKDGLTDAQIKELSPYGYVPTYGLCVLFVMLFTFVTCKVLFFSVLFMNAAVLVGHVILACWRKTWFCFPTIILAGLLEILGWSGRLWSSKNVHLDKPFMMQITATIFGPTPLLAAVFIIFGRIIRRLGTSYSVLRPRLYTAVFLTCDIAALVIQGAGGGLASSSHKDATVKLGSNIMLAGIVFQMGVIVGFVALAFLYWCRYGADDPRPNASQKDWTPRGRWTADCN